MESATPGVEHWLAALPDGDLDVGKLPSAVHAVAGRALRTAEHPDQPGEVAVSRVLSRAGTWVVLHGASLVSGGARRVARSVVTHRGTWIGVAGSDLDIVEVHAGVEHGRDEGMAEHVPAP